MTITRIFEAHAEYASSEEWDTGYITSTEIVHSGLRSYEFLNWSDAIRSFTATSQFRIGFFFRRPLVNSGVPQFISFNSGGSQKIIIKTDGINIYLTFDSTDMSTVVIPASFTVDKWMQIGLDVKIGVSGWVVFYINKVAVITWTGDSTALTGATVDSFTIGQPQLSPYWDGSVYYDDLFLDDTTGEVAAVAPPTITFTRLLPIGNGTLSQMTGSDGNQTNNYLLVDTLAVSSGSTYVKALSANLEDNYTVEDFPLPAGFPIDAVIYGLGAKKTVDLTPTTVKLVGVDGANRYESVELSLPGTNIVLPTVRVITQPDGAAWTSSVLNSMYFGQKSSGSY